MAVTPTVMADDAKLPNIIFVMADDLGYGDLGCYGQKLIKTPNLDRMAAEGMKFRQFYAGNTVCAPSRAVLMTGKHMGHVHVRGNAGAEIEIQTLRDSDVTVAEVLKQKGYATALCGKWGLGDEYDGGLAGIPNRQGFDLFYGYLNQVHAHNYYPEFLWHNRRHVPLKNVVEGVGRKYAAFEGGAATERVDYSHDLIAQKALEFVRQQGADNSHPFFLYLALTIPHANNEGTRMTGNGQEVPDYGEYVSRDWPDQDKGQAAMISRMDDDMGRLFALLKELNIDEETVVMFTSDNGPHNEGGHNPERFGPSGPLRGMKRDLYEGGIRVPFIVRWPGTTPANAVSNHIGYFGDLMATVGELSGAEVPDGLDSVSFAPEIRGQHEKQQPHDYLYWEFFERGSAQAVVRGNWKAVRSPMFTGKTELFDLSKDLGEATDIAAQHPDMVREMETIMAEAHQDHPAWQPRGSVPNKQSPPGHGKAPF
ncbi:MAG: arylsulfatase [Planctomycetaceae bacterium]|nr:arylsulfatase [Planctomycetaceae bacterium]